MKKHTSVMGLALNMTALPVLAVFALVGLLQWLTVNPAQYATIGFEFVLTQGGKFWNVARIGEVGAVALLIVLILCCVEFRGSRFTYTLRRLSVKERQVSWEFGIVFSGFFFLYWMFQLGMVLALYGSYARFAEPGQNGLMLAAYRSDYFHTLLPLADGWGYARNLLLCLSYGCTAALVSHVTRHGRRSWALAFLMVFGTVSWLPCGEASRTADIVLCVLLTAYLILYGYQVKRGDEDEEV